MKTGIRDWGLGIRNQRSGVRGRGPGVGEGSRFKAQGSRLSWGTRDAGEKENGLHLPTSHYPRAALPNPQSLIPNPSRRGISLMEVLISIFILSIGLLGVAAMIPIGKLAMVETAKSDRTGACGRAALREVKVRRMMNCANWFFSPPINPTTNASVGAIVLDPLGYLTNKANLGHVPRGTFSWITDSALADFYFRWHDDLVFNQPKDVTPVAWKSSTNYLAGDVAVDGEQAYFCILANNNKQPGSQPTYWARLGERPFASCDATGNIQYEGNFSWFLTISPSESELLFPVATRRNYKVAVAVCYKRSVAVADQTASVSQFLGGGVQLSTAVSNVKINNWVMLCGTKQITGSTFNYPFCEWYRVVSTGPGATTMLTLVGPDWDTSLHDPKLVVVDGVTGVYTTTVQLDNDAIWTR